MEGWGDRSHFKPPTLAEPLTYSITAGWTSYIQYYSRTDLLHTVLQQDGPLTYSITAGQASYIQYYSRTGLLHAVLQQDGPLTYSITASRSTSRKSSERDLGRLCTLLHSFSTFSIPFLHSRSHVAHRSNME